MEKCIEWDLTLPENEGLLQSAPYSDLEKVFVSIIAISSIIGLIANAIGFITLIFNRNTWDNEKCFLTGLAVADIVFLFSGLIFFIAPIAKSPVSFDVPFDNCWEVIGILLAGQVVSTGFVVAIAADSFWRICKKPGPDSMTSRATIAIVIVLTAFSSVIWAAPSMFTKSTEYCAIWPNSSIYENYPERVTICPPADFSSFPFIIFHDLIVFWIPAPLMIFWYRRVIVAPAVHTGHGEHGQHEMGRQGSSSGDPGTPETPIDDPPMQDLSSSNLITRIIIFVMCHSVARIYNFVDAIHRHYFKEPVIPFPSTGSELVYFVLRTLLMIQPTINAFIYFLVKKAHRNLVKKTFLKRE